MVPAPRPIDGVLPARPRKTPLSGGGLRLAAPAKLNLTLHVGPIRGDGFHPVRSIVAKVTLYDDVLLRPRFDGRIALRCTGADCGPAEGNLAVRAARLLAEATGAEPGAADIELSKSIPPGAGLGGGSSDAAAVLEGLAELWDIALPPERLAELAGRLGSDVPLFLGPPAASVSGRGERVEAARVHPFTAVVHLPPIVCPTAEVYAAFDRLWQNREGGVRHGPPGAHAGVEKGDRHLRCASEPVPFFGEPPSTWRGELRNDLAAAAFVVSDELRRTHAALAEAAGLPVSVTGSGSGLFILCDDAEEARAVLGRLPADLPGRTVLVGLNPF